MKRNALLIAALFVAFSVFALPAHAAGSLSITSISIPDSASQASSFTISLYASGSQVSSVKASLTLPSGVSCSPSTPQDVSLSASGTGSASWSCSASLAGDYTGQITASLSGTDSGTGGSLSDSQQTGLIVPAPASLAASSSALSASSVTASAASYWAVSVHNTGGETTNYSVSVSSSPSGVSASLVSGSVSGSITGGSVIDLNYSLSASSANTYNVSTTITGGNGQTLVEYTSLTVTASSSSTTTTVVSYDTPSSSTNQTQTINETQTNQTQSATTNETEEEALSNVTQSMARTQRTIAPRGIINNTKLLGALENVLAADKLADPAQQNLLQLSQLITSQTSIDRSARAEPGRTVVSTRIRYAGNHSVQNFTIYERVPKTFAEHAGSIIVSARGARSIQVVTADPEYLITYDSVEPGDEFVVNYTVSREISNSSSVLNTLVNGFSSELFADALIEEASLACTPNQPRCSDNVLERCSSDGLAWVVVEVCETSCTTSGCALAQKESVITLVSALIIFIFVGAAGIVGYLLYRNKSFSSPYRK